MDTLFFDHSQPPYEVAEKTMYKYRPVSDLSISSLSNNQLFFASSSGFNDPFDCNISPRNFDLDSRKLSNKHMQQFVELIEFQIESTKSMGILCLSEVYDNTLMWSHYAESHSGFCLGFNSIDSILQDCIAEIWFNEDGQDSGHNCYGLSQTIKYIEGNPFQDIINNYENVIIDYYDDVERQWSEKKNKTGNLILKNTNSKTFRNFNLMRHDLSRLNYSYKQKVWAYEKEHRILAERNGIYFYKPQILTEIYLGLNCTENSKNRIKEAIYESGSNPVIYQMVKSRSKIGLDYIRSS